MPKKPRGSNIVKANIEDRDDLQIIMEKFKPDCVIHCGGSCDLDKAEDNPDRAYDLNVNGAKYLKAFCQKAKLVYLSYDLVYSGETNLGSGYSELEIPDPLTVVGTTIVEAEKVILEVPNSLVIRLGLPMGPSVQGYKGAVDWIHSRFRNNRVATLLYDEIRSTINTEDLGPAVHRFLECDCSGIYHLGAVSTISIYGIGRKLMNKYNYPHHLLQGRTRTQFPPSPPRMGNVSLKSTKAYDILGWIPKNWAV